MIGERDGGAGRPGWGTGRMVGLFGIQVPEAQVFQDPTDDGGLVDDRHDTHGATAFGACQGVDFIDFLDEPGPVGAGRPLGRGLIQLQGGVGVSGFGVALAAGAVAVEAVVADQM